jgi:hypothetical protein
LSDGNIGIYKGETYVAKDAQAAYSCRGCAAKLADGKTDLEFCNAMPDCMGSDRRDKRDVIFAKPEGGAA